MTLKFQKLSFFLPLALIDQIIITYFDVVRLVFLVTTHRNKQIYVIIYMDKVNEASCFLILHNYFSRLSGWKILVDLSGS